MTSTWLNYKKEDRERIVAMKDGWIVQNLLTFSNSLVPNDDIKEYGIEYVQERLEKILGTPVEIEKREVTDLGIIYIAWAIH